jgi:hypothetical protein
MSRSEFLKYAAITVTCFGVGCGSSPQPAQAQMRFARPTMTGVFVNGRELRPQEVLWLQQFLRVAPGRYWLDDAWNFGYEGGPPLGNLAWVIRAQSSPGVPYQGQTAGGYIGSDGTTSYFFDPSTGASYIPGQGLSY